MNLVERAKEINKRITQLTAYNSGEIVKKAVNNELTVEQMYEYDKLFPSWEMGTFAVGDVRSHKDTLYRCIQTHTASNPIHTPNITPALWVVMRLEPDDDAILEWVAGEVVATGVLRTYNDKTYECIQGHTTQATYAPNITPALWKVVNTEPEETEEPVTYPTWKQPSGGHDAYNAGDIVRFNGKLYKSINDGNAYSPSAYPAGWELVP